MYSKTNSISTMAIIALLVACSSNNPVSEHGTLRFVSAPATIAIYEPDESAFWKSWDPIDLPKAEGKALTKINATQPKTVTAIRVMAINPPELYVNNPEYDPNFYSTHNRNNWDDRVEYYKNKPGHKVASEGVLKRDGNYAVGRVGITENRWNSVYFGFIVTGDTIGFLGLASYSSGNAGYEDGWYTIGTTPVDTVRLGNRIP
jgi:hypothetical protein